MPLDPAALDEYRDVLGDEFGPFFIDLIDTFFASGPEFIQTMKDALSGGDVASFTRAAHTMKSNCKTFGANEFAEKTFELEKLGNDKNLADAKDKLVALEADYQGLVAELENLRDSL
ncbi:MAG: Hpt domain-containing protein [Anaerolineales bacterium]|nr:Hpt domain-containing protein [Chloroflexota bacterium]MBL6981610.1 Hpt domain-containing protein [Anaerolineales bacterium]